MDSLKSLWTCAEQPLFLRSHSCKCPRRAGPFPRDCSPVAVLGLPPACPVWLLCSDVPLWQVPDLFPGHTGIYLALEILKLHVKPREGFFSLSPQLMERAIYLSKGVHPVLAWVSLVHGVNHPLCISDALVTAREASAWLHRTKVYPWFSLRWQE